MIVTKVPLIKWLMILPILHQLQPMFSVDMITNLRALTGHHGNVWSISWAYPCIPRGHKHSLAKLNDSPVCLEDKFESIAGNKQSLTSKQMYTLGHTHVASQICGHIFFMSMCSNRTDVKGKLGVITSPCAVLKWLECIFSLECKSFNEPIISLKS